MTVLSVSGLRVIFPRGESRVRAVDTVDLGLVRGDRLALIGESGCGKTVLGMAVMGLLPANAEIGGTIRYGTTDLLSASAATMQQLRGWEIAMVPQNSSSALNPVMMVGEQVAEPLVIHGLLPRPAALAEARRLLGQTGIGDPDAAAIRYPHEFSGGMRERVLIAIALACNPILIIADEPTAGLDAEIKRQVLELIKNQLAEKKTLLLITHDLGAARFLCTRIAVMYAGEIVEEGPLQNVMAMPWHPYTQGLIASHPSAGLHPIPGISPSPDRLPDGCRFSPRCPVARAECRTHHPLLKNKNGQRQVRCLIYD
jgi:peptide/nickel transport system ATP-binding protein